MFAWRVTKYNPENCDMHGIYLPDEWTAYSDIGKVIGGKLLTYAEYLTIENAYVAAILTFMGCNRLTELSVISLEKNLKLRNTPYLNLAMTELFEHMKKGLKLNSKEVEAAARLSLREELWCILGSNDAMLVRFSWDYYMYIGSTNKCEDTIYNIQQSGLFVEACDREYLE